MNGCIFGINSVILKNIMDTRLTFLKIIIKWQIFVNKVLQLWHKRMPKMESDMCFNSGKYMHKVLYSYRLGSWKKAILFDPRTDMLPETTDWGQQIPSRVGQNCCCLRNQSITGLLYIFSFSKFSYSPLHSRTH